MIFRTPARTAFSFSLALIFLVATSLLAQHLTAPQQSQVARLVHDMIESTHISQKQIDDTVSAKLVDEFVKTLDPQKLYFLQGDIDKFNKYRTELDDLIKAGNIDFSTMVFDLYLQRLNERIEVAHKLIDTPNDFSVKEYLEIDAKDVPWPKTVDELNERWRKRIKYEFLLMKLEKPSEIAAREKKRQQGNPDKVKAETDSGEPLVTTDEDARKRLHKRYKNIRDTLSKTEPEEVVEMYLTALCMTFDPHSNYMSPRAQKDFQIQMRLKLEGIGAALRSEDGYTIVASIVPGGAAAADARLKVNDKIIAVGNGTAEFVDVVEMKLTKVVEMIRGKAGTKVRLKVLTAAANDVKIYEMIRQQVELKSSEVKGEIIDSASRVKGTKGRIGIIHIPSFYRDFEGEEAGENDFKSTARDVKKVLHDFQAKGGVDAIVVDLRYNGGGALKEAIEVSGLFVGEGPVVQVKDQKGKPKVYRDDEPKPAYSGPLVVLTNRLSASASEIFAGVIKDYHRGLIVGDRTTHGKGTVQSVMPVGQRFLQLIKSQDLGALKLTINQFYRVNGDSTQNTGVPSDVALPSLLDNMDLGESFLDNAMPFDHIEPVPHRRMHQVTTEIASAIRENSRKRVAASDDFQKVDKDIEKYLARKQRKAVSLNEDDLRKERVEEEQKTREKAETSNDEFSEEPVFPDNSYNNEVLTILSDYVGMLTGANVSKK
ncbi:MAG: carboxy terminal-processing peptidase [Planctomycetia bacterium]|nr:carboxy terminal-processing peptidase [Planctomycetia bacterium]